MNLYKYLNSDELFDACEMQRHYLNITFSILNKELNKVIDNLYYLLIYSFNNEDLQNEIIFIVYISYLFLVYLFLWINFMNGIKSQLWKTKSILTILSPNIIMNIPEIKAFILKNSSIVLSTE